MFFQLCVSFAYFGDLAKCPRTRLFTADLSFINTSSKKIEIDSALGFVPCFLAAHWEKLPALGIYLVTYDGLFSMWECTLKALWMIAHTSALLFLVEDVLFNQTDMMRLSNQKPKIRKAFCANTTSDGSVMSFFIMTSCEFLLPVERDELGRNWPQEHFSQGLEPHWWWSAIQHINTASELHHSNMLFTHISKLF